MDSKDHFVVLQQVSDGSIPARVDAGTGLSLAAVADLVSGGHLAAAQVSAGSEPAFLNLTITPLGRQHLRRLRSLHPPESVRDAFTRMVPPWVRVVLAFLVVAAGLYLSERVSGHALW